MKLPTLTDKQNEKALLLSNKVTNPNKRQEAYADFACVEFFVDYMLKLGFFVNTKRSLFKCDKLYSDFEITDVYCNSHRLYIVKTNSSFVKVPVLHKTFGILPEAYVAVQFDSITKSAKVLGIIKPDDLETSKTDGKHYFYDINMLNSIEALKNLLSEKAGFKHSTGSHLECLKLINSYISNHLTGDEKKNMISHIINCESCKKKLFELAESKENTPPAINSEITKPLADKKDDLFERLKDKTAGTFDDLKNAIDIIYQDKDIESKEPFKIGFEIPFKLKKPIILTAATFFIVFAVIIGAFALPVNKAPLSEKEISSVVLEEDETGNYEAEAPSYDIKIPPINSKRGYVTVSNVSWEVPSSLNKEEQKKFLQQTGKTIKLNLQNDLLLSNEAVGSSNVKFEIKFYRDGNVESIEPVKSSGSGAVDTVIKQSLENTLQYMKPPKGSFVGNKNALVLNVKF